MEKWNHKSLEWIHRVREQNYDSTRGKSPEQIAKDTLKSAEDLIKALNLRVIYPMTRH